MNRIRTSLKDGSLYNDIFPSVYPHDAKDRRIAAVFFVCSI